MTKDDRGRFWKKVKKSKGCWNWQGALQSKGYGSFSVEGKTYLAHRIAYELTFGEIHPQMFVMHKCDNPRCVNPSHLREGTPLDNVTDMWRKGRAYVKGTPKKLTRRLAKQIRNYHGSLAAIARLFKVHPKTIKSIQTGKTWKGI